MEAVIQDFVSRGALFVISHSGGKDSQAMTIYLSQRVPREQMVIIHSHLKEVEWSGTIEHVRYSAQCAGISEVIVTGAEKTFFDMVERTGYWPTPKYRQCTSDLKRNPIHKTIRNYLKAHPEFNGLVVDCQGLRAEESPGRASLQPLRKGDAKMNAAGREWWVLLPIHHWSLRDVLLTIADSGQRKHWAYDKGMTRLSCVFCIMASKQDLRTAARLNPELFRRYVETEKRIGHKFADQTGEQSLVDIVGEDHAAWKQEVLF